MILAQVREYETTRMDKFNFVYACGFCFYFNQTSYRQLRNEPRGQSLRGEPRGQSLRGEVRKYAFPCTNCNKSDKI